MAGVIAPARNGIQEFLGFDKSKQALDRMAYIEFHSSAPQPIQIPVPFVAQLESGETIVGEFLKLDASGLRLRTNWAESVVLPRPWLSRLGFEPGWQLRSWRCAGAWAKPLSLEVFPVDNSIAAGRLGVTIQQEPGENVEAEAGFRWTSREGGTHRITWTWYPGETYAARNGQIIAEGFSKPTQLSIRGRCKIRDVVVFSRSHSTRTAALDWSQDALLLPRGDVVFGMVTEADRSRVRLTQGPRNADYLWYDISQIAFARKTKDSLRGEYWLELLTGDQLFGNILSWNGVVIPFEHARLGKLNIPLGLVRRVRRAT